LIKAAQRQGEVAVSAIVCVSDVDTQVREEPRSRQILPPGITRSGEPYFSSNYKVS
jgi:hypothetical protein